MTQDTLVAAVAAAAVAAAAVAAAATVAALTAAVAAAVAALAAAVAALAAALAAATSAHSYFEGGRREGRWIAPKPSPRLDFEHFSNALTCNTAIARFNQPPAPLELYTSPVVLATTRSSGPMLGFSLPCDKNKYHYDGSPRK